MRLTETLAALPGRLRADPDWPPASRPRRKSCWRARPSRGWSSASRTGCDGRVIADLQGESSEVVGWITARLDRARLALAEDAALRQELDRWLKERVTEVVDRYHDRIARFIERGVHALGPEGAVRLIEEHAGDDLQYIRVNGTVVGGLAGGGLYAIHLLLDLLLR